MEVERKQKAEMSKRRPEKEALEWVRVVFECIYGLLMTVLFIVKSTVELLIPQSGKSLAGDHVLVTGAARGLGREICLRLASEGCKLTCVDVQAEGCKQTAAMVNAICPNAAAARTCDITKREEVKQLIREIPPVDILVNNAGIVSSADILEVSEEHIDRMMQVNVMSHFWTIRAVLPTMIKRGKGHIVAIASAAAFTAAANIAPYTATKYAVTGMMASLREELRIKHPYVKTTTIHPFFISPPPSSVEHWDKTSRLPDVTATDVAKKTVTGIKREKVTVTVPGYLYFLLFLLMGLPSAAGELWRDMFYAKISPLDVNDNKPNGKIATK